MQTNSVAIYVGPPHQEGAKGFIKINWSAPPTAGSCRMFKGRFVGEYATRAFNPEV